jgi:UDP-glucose 4-epimerase
MNRWLRFINLGMDILVTGGTGFIGRHLVAELMRRGEKVTVLTRDAQKGRALWTSGPIEFRSADLANPASLSDACRGIEVIFHLAGHAQPAHEEDALAAGQHQVVTVDGTRALLNDALCHGVRRLVYASSVKAMGEGSDACLDETSPSEPLTAYGRSRRVAESMLLDAARNSKSFRATIIRLPLVYGRGNQGNLARMAAAIERGLFPPLPKMGNRRSMVWVGDAVQALLLAADKPEAKNQIYLVTDGKEYSTDRVYCDIRAALGKPPARWTVPKPVLGALARVGDAIGRVRHRPWVFDSVAYQKLAGSACYRSDKIQRELGFRPSRTLGDELPGIIDGYRRDRETT